MLEIEAFLISNALEDSLSGFTPEFDQYLRFLHQNTDISYLTGTWAVDDFMFVVDDDTIIEERFGGLTIGGCATIIYERHDRPIVDQSNYRAKSVKNMTCDNNLYIHSEDIEIYAKVDMLPEDHPNASKNFIVCHHHISLSISFKFRTAAVNLCHFYKKRL